jgi:hypothetical protein
MIMVLWRSLLFFFLLFHFEILLWKMNALNWLYNMNYCIHDANRVCNVCLCKLWIVLVSFRLKSCEWKIKNRHKDNFVQCVCVTRLKLVGFNVEHSCFYSFFSPPVSSPLDRLIWFGGKFLHQVVPGFQPSFDRSCGGSNRNSPIKFSINYYWTN